MNYMNAFAPFLYKALDNQEEPSLCSMAIGLVSDITRALNEKIQPYCDDFMNRLLRALSSQTLGNQFKPAILQCFGDIAQAIGGPFEVYLGVVAAVLSQAAGVNVGGETSFELMDYVISLREGIMDAWDGVVVAMKTGGKTQLLEPYIEPVFTLLKSVYEDQNRSEPLMRSSMGVIG